MAVRADLPKVSFHKSASRVVQLKGADRVGMILAGGISTYVTFAAFYAWGLFIGLPVGGAMFFFTFRFVHRYSKHDPMAREVFMRALRYRGFYPARGHSKGSRSYKGWVK